MNWSTSCQLNLHHACPGTYFDETINVPEGEVVFCQCRCHTKDRTPDLVAA